MVDGSVAMRQRGASMPVRPAGWWFDLALLVGFVAVTGLLATGGLLGADQAVADWVDAHRPAPLYWTARVLNYLGQGGQVLMPLAVLLAVIVTWQRRSVRPLLPVVGAFLVTFLTIGPLKLWFDRPAPRSSLSDRVVLFNSAPEQSMSYPSGHVANAIVWYGVIALLVVALRGARPLAVPAWVAIRVLPPAIVFTTTIYLGFHWITDSVAGLLLGLLLGRLLARVQWDALWLPALPGGWERPAGLDARG